MSLLSINSNVSALKAQRQLTLSTSSLSQTFQRLSTGLRINSASDDAAGLAISSSLYADARLFNAASRNVNDGISLLNIMDSALGSQADILQRLSELAQQASNGTFSVEQRSAINLEYQALVAESGRIGASTVFNEVKPLYALRDAGSESIRIQAGITGQETSQLVISGADTGSFSGVIDLQSLDSDPVNWLNFVTEAPHSREALFDTFDYVHELKVIDTEGQETTMVLVPFAYWNGNVLFSVFNEIRSNGEYDLAGGFYSFALDTDTGHLNTSGDTLFDSLTVFDTPNGASAQAEFSVNLSALLFKNAETTVLDFSGVETLSRAQKALSIVSNRLESINAIRGEVGAMLSRFESAANVLASSKTTYLEAASRITDADIAEETSNLVKNQILQQAAVSVHALAARQPETILSLLSN